MKNQTKCPMDALLRIISGQWTTYILWTLSQQPTIRFGELKRRISGISSRMLTERLRKLESVNFIYRIHEPTIPPKVSYGLTERGIALRGYLDGLAELAIEWDLCEIDMKQDFIEKPERHSA